MVELLGQPFPPIESVPFAMLPRIVILFVLFPYRLLDFTVVSFSV